MNDVAPVTTQAPAEIETSALMTLVQGGIIGIGEIQLMPIGTRIMLDDRLRDVFWRQANHMAKSPSCPAHLKDDPDTCFAVIRMALNWGLDWHQVAQSTYSPGPGKIGIEGKLAVGAMIGSRKVKSIKYEHGGSWDAIAGKFKMEASRYKDGNARMKDGQPVMKAVATYTPEDELGLFVIAIATMHDETEVSTPKVFMNACHPRNSTLWAANPRRQIMYVADRMLFQIACADILMGVHFDAGLNETIPEPIDITPPQAVDPAEEGIEGAGEVEAGTEQGVTEATVVHVGTATEETQVEAAKSPRRRATGKKVRVKLTFRGSEHYKTSFLRDLKQLAESTEDWEDFDQLRKDASAAIDTAEPESEREQLAEACLAILAPIADEFESPARAEDDIEGESVAISEDDTEDQSSATQGDEPRNQSGPALDLTS